MSMPHLSKSVATEIIFACRSINEPGHENTCTNNVVLEQVRHKLRLEILDFAGRRIVVSV